MRRVGPVRLAGEEVAGDFMVPLATYETPLWPSVARGAKVSVLAGGIRTVIVDERMSRSILLEAPSAQSAVVTRECLLNRKEEMEAVVVTTSRFAHLLDVHIQVVANLLYVRFELSTGDAAGHNMATAAADKLADWILTQFSDIRYVSISANYCTDKKPGVVNGILGRGRYVIAELVVPRDVCEKVLRTTPEKIANLNLKKNWIGTALAGAPRSANAHFANMLLAFYLATGQDAANIVEGSQGFVHAELRGADLYFSVTVPHIIVGTVGSGKDLDFVRENLRLLGCLEERAPGENAGRLAAICGATVLCGELSLLAAQTNPGELMRAHTALERRP